MIANAIMKIHAVQVMFWVMVVIAMKNAAMVFVRVDNAAVGNVLLVQKEIILPMTAIAILLIFAVQVTSLDMMAIVTKNAAMAIVMAGNVAVMNVLPVRMVITLQAIVNAIQMNISAVKDLPTYLVIAMKNAVMVTV
jgi:hypothetical protein